MRISFRSRLFIAILLLGAAGTGLRWTALLDYKLLDVQFAVLRSLQPQTPQRDVVIVGIDESTVKAFAEPVSLWHRHLGQFLGALASARPAVLGIDIVLPERSYEAVAPGYDVALLRGLIEARRAYPLVLAMTVDPAGKTRPVHLPFIKAAGDGASGFALMALEADGVVRRFDEGLGERGEKVPTLAGQMARRLGIEPRDGLIDFARGVAFDYIPLHQVLSWHAAQDTTRLASAFQGKAVLLGTVLRFEDRQRMPVALAAWERGEISSPGVLVHAQVVRNLLGRGLLHAMPLAAVMALTLVATLLWWVSARAVLLVLVALALIAGLAALSTLLLHAGWHLPVVWAALTGFTALGARNGYEALLQLREQRRLRLAFGGYVSPEVMREILAGGISPELGGVKRFVCIMFSDIRGYTTRSEHMTPEQVIGFLNRYFEETVAIIHRHGGSVVSFMGDGIMAVFGAPNTLDNACANAFEAGREMLAHVTEFNARQRHEGEPPVDIGVGLHAGEAVVGHIGSSARHDYSAIGDATNVASRIESLTKDAGYRLLCSRAVMERLQSTQMLTPLGPSAIKGHAPVEVWGYDRL
jgi:class 3 adenylate cyclase